jgi:hypothetical protein
VVYQRSDLVNGFWSCNTPKESRKANELQNTSNAHEQIINTRFMNNSEAYMEPENYSKQT